MDDSIIISALGSLIEFYSRRAEAHASYFFSSFFGLFAILAIVYSKSKIRVGEKKLWSVIFWALFFMGSYFLMNYRYYATFADQLRQNTITIIEYQPEMDRIRDMIIKNPIMQLFYCIKSSALFQNNSMLIFGGGYSLLVMISYLLGFWPKNVIRILRKIFDFSSDDD